jgi:hypothetical protein
MCLPTKKVHQSIDEICDYRATRILVDTDGILGRHNRRKSIALAPELIQKQRKPPPTRSDGVFAFEEPMRGLQTHDETKTPGKFPGVSPDLETCNL